MAKWGKNIQPPSLFEGLLSWSLPTDLKEPILGDLSEEYLKILNTENTFYATYWYVNQSLLTAYKFMWQTQRGILMFIIGVLIFLALMVMGMVLGGQIGFFWDVPSVLMVIVPSILLGMGATSSQSFKLGVALLFSDIQDIDNKGFKAAAKSFLVTGNSALWVGLAATMIGWVAIGSNVTSAEFADVIGPAFAVSILTIMYGVIIKVLCYVAEQKVLYKMEQAA